jgi:hypothetical protein
MIAADPAAPGAAVRRSRGFTPAVATADQARMRRLRTLSCLLLPACAAGCLEIDHTVTLAGDGSGRQEVRMTIPERAFAELERAAAASGATATSTTAVFDEAQVGRELTAAGLTLDGHRTERGAKGRTVELAATFPAFAALQRSPLAGSQAEWVLARGPKPGTAKLTLYPQGKAAWTEARAKAQAMAGTDDALVDAFFHKRREQLAGLDVAVRFRLPGDVLVWTANMDKTGAREVTARVTAAQIGTPQDLVRRLAPRFEVIFDARGCALGLE